MLSRVPFLQGTHIRSFLIAVVERIETPHLEHLTLFIAQILTRNRRGAGGQTALHSAQQPSVDAGNSEEAIWPVVQSWCACA
jgi:hypothetical protein